MWPVGELPFNSLLYQECSHELTTMWHMQWKLTCLQYGFVFLILFIFVCKCLMFVCVQVLCVSQAFLPVEPSDQSVVWLLNWNIVKELCI